MEKKANILGTRPISAARDRPEFGFSILEKGAHQRYSTNQPSPRPKQPEGPKAREGIIRRSSSFCGEGDKVSSSTEAKSKKMRRPKTHPELLVRDRTLAQSELRPSVTAKFPQELAAPSNGSKLLVNVTVIQSIGALRVLVSEDATVEDVTRGALVLYAKEGRRPILGIDPVSFGLHYSQFSMDCLDPSERIKDLGSRNFFLCPEAPENAGSCGTQMGQASRIRESWCKVMDCFLLLP